MNNTKSTTGLSNANNSSQKRKSGSHLIFILCVLIASFFWLLIKLSDQYNESFEFKLKYNNFPTEKMLTSILDTNLNVTINAQGFEMLKLVLTEDLSEVNINLENFEIIHLRDNLYYINTDEVKEKIGDFIGIPINQVEIAVTKLEFEMEDLFEKKIEIEVKTKFSFISQYNLYGEIINYPTEVTVFGPKKVLDTINSISTENKTISNISTNIDEDVKLFNPAPKILHLAFESVNIKANVEKFTESSIETTIDLSNINHNTKAFPPTVKVFFTVAQKDFSNIRQTQFKVGANIKGIDVMTAKKLQLEVIEKPSFINGIRLQPSEIEFLIIK